MWYILLSSILAGGRGDGKDLPRVHKPFGWDILLIWQFCIIPIDVWFWNVIDWLPWCNRIQWVKHVIKIYNRTELEQMNPILNAKTATKITFMNPKLASSRGIYQLPFFFTLVSIVSNFLKFGCGRISKAYMWVRYFL